MRYLVLSDIHSNIEALETVMTDARRRGFDRAVVLGDIVGYGASPNEVIDLLKDLNPVGIVRGNHDKAASGITDGESFNDVARLAALWTRAALTEDNLGYLHGLDEGPLEMSGFLLSHGSPLDEEEYILGDLDAAQAFEEGTFDLAFFGHTHFACCFVWETAEPGQRGQPGAAGRSRLRMGTEPGQPITLDPSFRYLVNPGSIGQPRDHDPRAAYAIYDDERRDIQMRRVIYDVRGAALRIEAAGLPPVLGQRLMLGI